MTTQCDIQHSERTKREERRHYDTAIHVFVIHTVTDIERNDCMENRMEFRD